MTDGEKKSRIPPAVLSALEVIQATKHVAQQQELIAELKAQHPEQIEFIEGWLYAEGIYAEIEPAPDDASERQIGPYTLLECIGEGGFGKVYVAKQKVPMDRRVAIKLIQVGKDFDEVLERFRRERQILASLDHPAIAKVFDGGLTEDARPYFVMEFIEGGKPLTTYCDDHRLSIRDRILLFQQVCRGVQHSHQRGIMHRDLKPANILVCKVGDQHVPKIIDFGIAKDTTRLGQDGHSMLTGYRQTLGTLGYMAPEQAAGELVLTMAVDVYALGVILYELLAGRLPFEGRELHKKANDEILRVLREDEPKKPSTRISDQLAADQAVPQAMTTAAERRKLQSPSAWARAVRGDLDMVTMMALRKAPKDRYPSPSELAADLQRYLDHDPVKARKGDLGYRVRKFVRKYRVQVGAVVAVVVASLTFGGVAMWQYGRAETKATEALEQKGRADAKVHEFDQLAGVVLYERAVVKEATLYPAWPHKVEAMETWLREDAGQILAMQKEIERTVRELEGRALPPTAEQQEADRKTHPRFGEWEAFDKRLASLRYAQGIRAARAQLVVPDLSAAQQALDVQALNMLAWDRVSPKSEERKVYGEEALGLAAARLAAQKAHGTPSEFQVLDTLAWALVANGQDGPAKEASDRACKLAPEEQLVAYEGSLRDVLAAGAQAPAALALAEQQLSELTTTVNERRVFRFKMESQRFLHDTLADLLGKLGALAAKKAEVDRRLAWAKRVHELSLAHPNARHTWAEVRAAIAQNPRYAGQMIELRAEDITGLVPIGENPVTHLWEFYELRSAWDGKMNPSTIEIPKHEFDGAIKMTGITGIVFVLLPGGKFLMGAQNQDKDGPNFDPVAQVDRESPVHEVTLSPFFLARHELTRGQWQRLSATTPFWWKEGVSYEGDRIAIGPMHPADSVDWEMANRCMEQHGMVLPTEPQWEYGCRAGATTVFWSGSAAKALQGVANLHDQTSVKLQPQWGTPAAITDGFTGIAPVGSFQSNAFGLFDVHGNVWEWCRDWYGRYGNDVRHGDGYRLVGDGSGLRMDRGGSHMDVPSDTRSAQRGSVPPSARVPYLGLRPARTMGP